MARSTGRRAITRARLVVATSIRSSRTARGDATPMQHTPGASALVDLMTFPGSTRLGHKDQAGGPKDENLPTLLLHPTNGRDVYRPRAATRQNPPPRSFQRRSLPFILANWYSNNTGSSSHRHDRSFKLVRNHYDALSGPGHLSELRVILEFPRPPSDRDHFTTCVSISRLVGRFGHAGRTAGSALQGPYSRAAPCSSDFQ